MIMNGFQMMVDYIVKTSSREGITYSVLVDRICIKMAIYPCKKMMNLSYTPLVVSLRDNHISWMMKMCLFI